MTSIDVLADRARTLLALHRPGTPVILPTVWDAWSAKLAVDAGFTALTVGSHPVADSIGKTDNEGMSYADLLTRVAQITDAVDVPISVDIESGYGESPQRLVSADFWTSVRSASTSRTPSTATEADCVRRPNTPSSSARCVPPRTRRRCTS